ncbi:Bug family tripartite tricarboxylate transporter substrate binding protein [Paenibacillus naphthalenovorans]|uniref:Bug family tripartite tricarboxylate transporter substrate binding protein n=1 Tax=Paenibacillus naphthalenovorans TaxID=162209 RepID=UPI00088293F8|nr:tripartite tricarboxylate transporter substrate binding protein [Paenibacillus naphthalenovorans]SDI83457.1 Tripartite-type tricarboxylate transporter, receptor component TctC [Paenibacillus naphthalenovorans]
MIGKIKSVMASVIILSLAFTLAACGSQSQTQPAGGTADSPSTPPEDDYPNKPINLVIPFSPGVAGDTFSRTFAKIAEKYVGQPFVPVNKEGGSGAVGVSYMMSQPADGYTITYHSSTFAYTMASGQVPFKTKDIVPIASINADYQVLAVLKESPFSTFDDFVRYAKANPGKLKVSGSQTKGTNHVFLYKILKEAGIEANYIPYDGGSKTLLALLGGNVDALVSSSSVVNQHVDSGEVRILAVTGSERAPNRPDVPTFKELGLTNIVDENLWRAFFGKPGIPQHRLEKLSKAFEQVIQDPEWRKFMETDQQIDFYKNTADFTEYFNNYVTDAEEVFKNLE